MSIKISENLLEVYYKDKKERSITKEDIVKIDLYMSASNIEYGYSLGGYTWEEYNYAIIKTINDDILINNLLYPEIGSLNRYFQENKMSYHKRLFAILP
ncbi:hypothetical protein [Pedobacter punctiformis]|nr:hypothetical protein [Pedobacter sp. HCMS5-2]